MRDLEKDREALARAEEDPARFAAFAREALPDYLRWVEELQDRLDVAHRLIWAMLRISAYEETVSELPVKEQAAIFRELVSFARQAFAVDSAGAAPSRGGRRQDD
ncbi:MAG: hypothetical protein QHH05_02780 [Syntrophomonadaceae bacterium]|jgi:hypothetical protein|nr:hypothetical protein [Syntrophomonadaceae bacterium]MDH7497357.1 hypothetical protein [Syntrophomonadaceae bacterium]